MDICVSNGSHDLDVVLTFAPQLVLMKLHNLTFSPTIWCWDLLFSTELYQCVIEQSMHLCNQVGGYTIWSVLWSIMLLIIMLLVLIWCWKIKEVVVTQVFGGLVYVGNPKLVMKLP